MYNSCLHCQQRQRRKSLSFWEQRNTSLLVTPSSAWHDCLSSSKPIYLGGRPHPHLSYKQVTLWGPYLLNVVELTDPCPVCGRMHDRDVRISWYCMTKWCSGVVSVSRQLLLLQSHTCWSLAVLGIVENSIAGGVGSDLSIMLSGLYLSTGSSLPLGHHMAGGRTHCGIWWELLLLSVSLLPAMEQILPWTLQCCACSTCPGVSSEK